MNINKCVIVKKAIDRRKNINLLPKKQALSTSRKTNNKQR